MCYIYSRLIQSILLSSAAEFSSTQGAHPPGGSSYGHVQPHFVGGVGHVPPNHDFSSYGHAPPHYGSDLDHIPRNVGYGNDVPPHGASTHHNIGRNGYGPPPANDHVPPHANAAATTAFRPHQHGLGGNNLGLGPPLDAAVASRRGASNGPPRANAAASAHHGAGRNGHDGPPRTAAASRASTHHGIGRNGHVPPPANATASAHHGSGRNGHVHPHVNAAASTAFRYHLHGLGGNNLGPPPDADAASHRGRGRGTYRATSHHDGIPPSNSASNSSCHAASTATSYRRAESPLSSSSVSSGSGEDDVDEDEVEVDDGLNVNRNYTFTSTTAASSAGLTATPEEQAHTRGNIGDEDTAFSPEELFNDFGPSNWDNVPPTDSISVPTSAARSFIGGIGRDDPSGYHDDSSRSTRSAHASRRSSHGSRSSVFRNDQAPLPATGNPNNAVLGVPAASAANHTGDHETPGAHSVLGSLPAHRTRTPVSPSVDGARGSVATRRSARRGAGAGAAGGPSSIARSTRSSSRRINQTDN